MRLSISLGKKKRQQHKSSQFVHAHQENSVRGDLQTNKLIHPSMILHSILAIITMNSVNCSEFLMLAAIFFMLKAIVCCSKSYLNE